MLPSLPRVGTALRAVRSRTDARITIIPTAGSESHALPNARSKHPGIRFPFELGLCPPATRHPKRLPPLLHLCTFARGSAAFAPLHCLSLINRASSASPCPRAPLSTCPLAALTPRPPYPFKPWLSTGDSPKYLRTGISRSERRPTFRRHRLFCFQSSPPDVCARHRKPDWLPRA